MPIWSRKWALVDYTVEAAPQDAGVYALWDRNELVYLGATGGNRTLRICLMEHLNAADADHYSWEVAEDPAARLAEVLGSYVARHGKPPRGNAPPS